MAKIYERPGLLEVKIENNNKSKEQYLNENVFSINVIANPLLVEMFEKHHITRRGQYTWSLRNTPENRVNFINFYKEYQEIFTPYTLAICENNTTIEHQCNPRVQYPYTQPLALTNSNFSPGYGYTPLKSGAEEFFEHHYTRDVPREILTDTLIDRDYVYNITNVNNGNREVYQDNFSPFTIVMNYKKDTMYFRLKFHNISYSQYCYASAETLPLNVISGMQFSTITPVKPILLVHDFLTACRKIRKNFNYIFTEQSIEEIDAIEEIVEGKLLVSTSLRNPNEVKVINASKVQQSFTTKILKRELKFKSGSETICSMKNVIGIEENNPNTTIVHPALLDIQNMVKAKEYTNEERLYAYQRRAVGLQLSTNIGFINALDTGIGKSIVQLTAMRERSKTIPNYRGIIVCQSNVIKQWKEYAHDEKWFPEAEIVIVNSGNKKVVNKLVETLSKEKPVIVLITFNMIAKIQEVLEEREELKELVFGQSFENRLEAIQDYQRDVLDRSHLGDVLIDMEWNDVCADEATVIRNDFGSKQSQAMWYVRDHSEIGTALTATPLNKSIKDIERLLCWVRNDKRMFYGNSLDKTYDLENLTEKEAAKIFDSLYPMVFRFTKEEAEAEEKGKIKIPKELEPETLLLEPSAAELALSNACEYELKRIVQELEIALNNFEATTKEEKEELDAAREELKNAHGHWLAGTNIARMATSNPSSILKSKSIAAQLLVGQGLVQEAIKDVPTKQQKLIPHALKKIAEGKQVLVFTDFVDAAETLADAFNQSGVRAGVFGGSNLKKRDQNRIDFQNGGLDVLVCTKAAERGLTLHKASVTYHYDLSWTLEPLLQKAGRAARVGSENEEVETYFIILKGTIEEKVLKKVFSQGVLSNLVLDKARGVDVKSTTTGKLMGGLTSAVNNINTRKGALSFGKDLLGL